MEDVLLMKIQYQLKIKKFFTDISTNDLVPFSWNSFSSWLIIFFTFKFPIFTLCNTISHLFICFSIYRCRLNLILQISKYFTHRCSDITCSWRRICPLFLLSSQLFSIDSNSHFFVKFLL